MYSLTVCDHIMIAHSFQGAEFGPAQRMHGATFAVEAEFRAPSLDHHQLLVDIGLAKTELRKLLDTVDYSNLDENPVLKGISPVSIGDGPKWVAGQPKESMFSLYSTSIVGVFGAIVNTIEVEGILALNCNATDFYAKNKFPVYLYYNPYKEAKTVTYTSKSSVDLFDIVSKKYLAKNGSGRISIALPADEATLVVVLPVGTRLRREGTKVIADDVVIAFK